jgi:hypothetical protein
LWKHASQRKVAIAFVGVAIRDFYNLKSNQHELNEKLYLPSFWHCCYWGHLCLFCVLLDCMTQSSESIHLVCVSPLENALSTLEHRFPTNFQCMNLHNKIGWTKVNICRLRKMVFLLVKCCAPGRDECNKYDQTAAPCCWLANHNDWSRWFAISSSHLFAVLASVLWVGLQNSK